MKLNIIPVLLFIIVSVFSCNSSKQLTTSLSLSQTDSMYSVMSEKVGRNKTFLAMFDTTGVILTANHLPVAGLDSIKNYLSHKNDSTFTLTWKPLFEKTAKCGDLGYTYGIWWLYNRHSHIKISEGTYTTFWKKDIYGNWKALLDTGNEGLTK